MINKKNRIVGILAIALISTPTIKQVHDLKTSNRLSSLLSNTKEITTSVAPEMIKIDSNIATEQLDEKQITDTTSQTGNIIDTLPHCENNIGAQEATMYCDNFKPAAPVCKGQAIVDEAKKYLGVKYVYGGSSPKGFDCSGLVHYVCKSVGVSVNRTSAAQFNNGEAVSKSDLQPGDLLFFAKNGKIHHVGIYVGNGQMIHAPQTGDVVKYSSINTAYRQKEYAGARRVY